jgi:hypothetical protein
VGEKVVQVVTLEILIKVKNKDDASDADRELDTVLTLQ